SESVLRQAQHERTMRGLPLVLSLSEDSPVPTEGRGCVTQGNRRPDMLLLIDNYDSFTFNLYQYLMELGQEVEVYRNDQITVEDCLAMRPDHVVISPGPCSPAEAGISVDLVRAFEGRAPLLGVCLGHQCIAEAYGGDV